MSREVVVRTISGRRSVSITRGDLEAVCGDLFDTTAEIIERVLEKAQAPAGAVDDVIMVGGSSRIPALADRLQQMLGVSPRLLEPDLGVAKGAALRAHHLARTPQLAALSQYSRQVRDAAGGPGEPGDPPGDRHSG